MPIPKLSRRLQRGLFLFFIFSFVLVFQNCSEFSLNLDEMNSSASTTKEGLLKPPASAEAPLRVIFLVDQSHSMKYAGCDTDLDGINPSSNPFPCNEGPGIDPMAYRFSMIELWMDNLKLLQYNAYGISNTKVAVIPFSGGRKQPEPPLGGYQFVSLSEAQTKLNELKQVHLQEPIAGDKKMGTTVPLDPIQQSQTLVDDEMLRMSENESLSNATYEVILITDGYFKPYASLLEKTLEMANCPKNCQSNSHPACKPSNTVGWEGGVDPYLYCSSIIPQKFAAAFGAPSDNDPEALVLNINTLLNLPSEHFGGALNFRLVKTAYNQPSENNTIDYTELLDQQLSSNSNFKLYEVDSVSLPFSLRGKSSPQMTFMVNRFFAINLNARIDQQGQLVVDSDADGLSDKEELQLGFNPLDPRSASEEGKCFDGIFLSFGCETKGICDPMSDDDGDGLNECEEMTVNTDALVADTDLDNIFDLFELMGMGLNPNVNESGSFRSGDGFTDHQHFSAGVHVQTPMSSIKNELKIEYSVFELDSVVVKSPGGQPLKMRSYRITADNLPLVQTAATSYEVPTYQRTKRTKYDVKKIDQLKSDWIMGLPSEEGTNQYVFLINMISAENPNSTYWLMLRKDIKYNPTNTTRLKLDLSEFKELKFIKSGAGL